MYELYIIDCKEKKIEPVKSLYYRYIFYTQFNIDFLILKTDRCGTYEVFKNMSLEKQYTIRYDNLLC